MKKTFLQAEWRRLAMANYAVDKNLLAGFLPHKTELDVWNNTCYVSIVGFMFMNTKVKGIKIPFHINFEEVNLRFYVKHKENGEWKRGVVFIKEIVPRPALTFVANWIYKENYQTLPMSHQWEEDRDSLSVEYRWKKQRWNSLKIITNKNLEDIQTGSEEEFITEHYWGYTKIGSIRTSEYEVEHPRWKVHKTLDYSIDIDFAAVYGVPWGFLSEEKPTSVFLAEGSWIKVKEGKLLEQ